MTWSLGLSIRGNSDLIGAQQLLASTGMASRIVWVFGAGLSKPLGGPLFTELFSPRFLAVAGGMAPDQELDLLNVGAAFDLLHEQGIVEDAEDFLAVLETACDTDNPQAPQCTGILRALSRLGTQEYAGVNFYYPDTEEERQKLLRQARLQVALACDSFVPRDQTSSVPESWSFMKRWVNEFLDGDDTIITFNYDRAVEWIGGEKVWPLLPKERIPDSGQRGALLLKLHGSVEWWKEGDGSVERFNTNELVDRADKLHESLILGVPGPGKSGMSTRELEPLWARAREAITDAGAVVIVGYSMPDTDGYAMELITAGLRKNVEMMNAANRTAMPRVHLVLGPDLQDINKQRLIGYLKDIVGERRLNIHPAYAQGFFLSKAPKKVHDRSAYYI